MDDAFPEPRSEICHLSSAAARAPDSGDYIELKRLVVEVDELLIQARWHVGRAVLLQSEYPSVITDTPLEDEFAGMKMPTAAALLLRSWVREIDVLDDDMEGKVRGCTRAGWIFHMMVDSAIYRYLSALDRVARVLCIATGVQFDRTYFRSRQMREVADLHATQDVAELADIAESDLFQLILDYRDGLAHTRQARSAVSGTPLTNKIDHETGIEFEDIPVWPPSYLIALARATHAQVARAVALTGDVCGAKWQPGADSADGPHLGNLTSA